MWDKTWEACAEIHVQSTLDSLSWASYEWGLHCADEARVQWRAHARGCTSIKNVTFAEPSHDLEHDQHNWDSVPFIKHWRDARKLGCVAAKRKTSKVISVIYCSLDAELDFTCVLESGADIDVFILPIVVHRNM